MDFIEGDNPHLITKNVSIILKQEKSESRENGLMLKALVYNLTVIRRGF